MIGLESHWGAEDQTLHAAYESAVDRRVDFMTHGSSLLDPFLAPVTVEGDTPEEIAEAVALFVEQGGDAAEYSCSNSEISRSCESDESTTSTEYCFVSQGKQNPRRSFHESIGKCCYKRNKSMS
jgi:hypothetical protein